MKLINVPLHDLEAVLAVAEHGSFRGAAIALNVSQPSISARIRHAEDVLGVKLFHRTTRKVTITDNGDRLRLRAEHALSELRLLTQEFRDEARLDRGRVVVGATPSIAAALLPSILERFRQKWSGIDVILRDDFLGRALDRVHTGGVDFAVTPTADNDRRFQSELLTSEEFLLIARKEHALVQRSTVTLRDAANYPLLTLRSQSATHELLRSAYTKAGLGFFPSFETDNLLSVFAMVNAGFGFAFVPTCTLALLNMNNLKVAHVVPDSLYRTISITRAKGRSLQPAALALIEVIQTEFNK